MKDRVESTISILLRARKRRRRWVVLLLVLAILAVAGPFYAFRMNAIAKTHQKRVLVCAAESGAVSHIHNDDCYLNGVLVCQLEEIEPHEHAEECFESVLFCGLEENDGHQHDDSCWAEETVLSCGMYEHTHDEHCYETQQYLTCGMEEGEGAHHHDESCYESVLICEKPVLPVHRHTSECFEMVEMTKEEIEALGELEDLSEIMEEDMTEAGIEGPETDETDTDEDGEEITDEEAENIATGTSNNSSIRFEALAGNVLVTVDADADAFPEGTELKAKPVYDEAVISSVADAASGSVVHVQAVDITFLCDGEEIEPTKPIRVTMMPAELPETDAVVEQEVIHIDHSGEATVVEQQESAANEVIFDADSFSVYAIAYVVIEKNVIASDGETYHISLSYDASAGIPENAELSVAEILPNSDEYGAYMQLTDQTIENEMVSFARFFDITILAEGMEVQPAAPVEVKIELADEMDDSVKAVHFGEEVEVIDAAAVSLSDGSEAKAGAETAVSEVSFSAESFSVYGVILTTLEKTITASDGNSYQINVTFGADAKIPLDAELMVEEIVRPAIEAAGDKDPESDAEDVSLYDDYIAKIESVLEDNQRVAFARFFDICIVSDNIEIQPAGTVEVKIELADELTEDVKAVHFEHLNGEDEIAVVLNTSLVATAEMDGAVVFEADGFSVFGVVKTETLTAQYMTADGETYEVTVTYSSDAGIPDDAQLLVTEFTEDDDEYDDYVEQTAAAIDTDPAVLKYIKLLDISIADINGEKVNLAAPVDVQIRLLDKDSIEYDVKIVHFSEDAETNSVEPELLENTADGDTVAFQTVSFSAYAIVQGPAAIPPGWLRATSLSDLRGEMASGGLYIGSTNNYYLTNNTTEHVNGNNSVAGLSGIARSSTTRNYPTDDAVLYYFEPVEGQSSQFYIYCYDNKNNKLYATYDTAATDVPYSIILTDDESLKTPCTLSVSGSGATAYWRIRFNNDASLRWYLRNNIFDAQKNDTNFYFWKYDGGETYGLDGKTCGLMYWIDGIMGKGLMSNSNETEGHLDALALTVMSKPNNGAKLYVPDNSDLSFWTFHLIEEDYYYLTTVVDGSTKYLRIGTTAEGLSLVSTPDDSCKIRVVPGSGANAGKICLKVGNRTLAYSGDIDSGFQIGGAAGNEWLNLVEESELTNDYFMTYSASKMSVSDESVTNGSRIIVYTRVWNDTTKKYEFYAIDQDGSLVRCYESGDSIEWVGGRLNSMLWNFVEYYWEGTTDPNYYYELYNQYSEKYIAPQASDGQILSDGTIGINLDGRRNGLYYSPIVAWDDAYYAYAGLKADTTAGKIVSCPLDEADDFYFAIVQDLPVDDELTTVPTIDHTQYGITMKMINFGTDLYVDNNNTNVRAQMSSFLGSDNAFHQYGTEAGLLNTALGSDGYPVSKAGNSLSTWFANAQDVNHLFIASTYYGTGYYEYDSVQNFAHLDPETSEFVVYKEIGSDSDTGVTHRHGLFWPYNDIKAGVFSVNKNTTAISSQALPESDPRKYEALYQVQKSNTNYAPDYYFGMEVTATFTQTPNGLDDWGHDIIYEFTGDDDFWLFVDGELIIDLGGIHSAISGSVNYKTGVVIVNGETTSLRGLFESNYRSRNTDATDEEVAEYLNGIFDGEIFKDYTSHTMKIYYLERGAGSSNLHMRFNLASIKPNTAQLTKKLSGVDTTETILAEFPYRIIYRTKTGEEEPVEHYLTNSVADDADRIYNYVFYKDSTVPCTYQKEMQIAGKTYHDVFILKPDETVDINFPVETLPEGTELLDYRIIECGINTTVYTDVKANNASITGTAVQDDQGNTVESRADFGIGYATTNDRARVVYENVVNPDAITNLTITKKLYDVTGENEITEAEDNTTFDFRLYLATDSGDIDNSPANMHTYHVKDVSGNYCYWSVEQQRLLSLGAGKNNFSELSEDEKASATFHTSMNGSITKIPVGYTIEVRDLLVGTKFKLVERPWEIPDGYSFLKYLYNSTEYTNAIIGVNDSIYTNVEPHVEVRNIKGFGLRVNKTWADADYMSERDPVYFGIFYQDSDEAWSLVPNSLRQMPYGTTTLYWYYDRLPVDGISEFSEYIIYEVKVDTPIVDGDGYVTGYSQITLLNDNDTISLNGKQVGDTETSQYMYTVTYERGESSSNSNVRIDTVHNSRPGIIIKKTKWDGSTPLAGAVFTLVDEDNNTIGTYTSGEDGLVTEAFFRNGVEYTLTEISAPTSWHGLEASMVIKLDDSNIVINGVDQAYYSVTTENDNMMITVKNRPYEFKVIKMDKGSDQPLQGVKFALYREIVVGSVHSWDPNPYPGYESLTSDANGIVIDNTLPAGKYQLRETSVLSGYQALSGHITFTISNMGVVALDANAPEEAKLVMTTDENGSMLYQITVTNTKVYKVSIWKTNEGYTTITSGASFSLYKSEDYNDETGAIREGATAVISGMTGTNGILALGSLTVGEYRLIETQAPAGYNPASSAIKIFVNNNGVTAMQGISPSDVYKKGDQYWVTGQDSSTLQIRVWNSTGYELPQTGGPGTALNTILGTILTILSGAALIKKKYA